MSEAPWEEQEGDVESHEPSQPTMELVDRVATLKERFEAGNMTDFPLSAWRHHEHKPLSAAYNHGLSLEALTKRKEDDKNYRRVFLCVVGDCAFADSREPAKLTGTVVAYYSSSSGKLTSHLSKVHGIEGQMGVARKFSRQVHAVDAEGFPNGGATKRSANKKSSSTNSPALGGVPSIPGTVRERRVELDELFSEIIQLIGHDRLRYRYAMFAMTEIVKDLKKNNATETTTIQNNSDEVPPLDSELDECFSATRKLIGSDRLRFKYVMYALKDMVKDLGDSSSAIRSAVAPPKDSPTKRRKR